MKSPKKKKILDAEANEEESSHSGSTVSEEHDAQKTLFDESDDDMDSSLDEDGDNDLKRKPINFVKSVCF